MKEFKIFLIEDDDEHAEIMQFHLDKREGASILYRASDGEDALRQFGDVEREQAQRPDLILLDINIPKVSGLDVLKEIKSRPALTNIPVVAFTTSQSQRDRDTAYQNHINSYLVKPADFGEFDAIVDQLLSYWSKHNVV